MSLFGIPNVADEDHDSPYKAIVTKVYDKTGDGGVDMIDVAELFKSGENKLATLHENGDFRSRECLDLLKEADIVVTNPPFSLFREYISVLIENNKKFLIIGHQNAIKYREIFPLFKNNKLWLGYGFQGNVAFFESPYEDIAVSSQHKAGFIRVSGVMWFTNLDIKKRHENMILIKRYNPEDYPQYLNFNAIDVSSSADIPYDYDGLMGVPITFMSMYNPEQFEIIGLAESNLGISIGFSENLSEEECNKLFHENKSFRRGNPIYRGKDGKLHKPFARIIIRNKYPEV